MTWTALLADALVGTDRRTGAEPADLLDRSAAWAAFRRAGVRPLTSQGSRPAAAGPESRPLIGERAVRRLELLLDGEAPIAVRDDLLLEWLELVRDRGRRVPPELLPELLAFGRSHRESHALIAEVGGARVRWLAEQNPEWTYLTRQVEETADPQAWETGSHNQRRGYLRALRRDDPAAARALLAAEWAGLAPTERADLLATLATGLGPEDEPLLESALDDRRKEVRTVAAELLAGLPGSAYQARAADRARRHLIVAGQGIEVRLPEACDQGMRRDGIIAKPPAGTGERAWWLEELLARAPLSSWPLPPETLLTRLSGHEWATAVHRGLSRAAAVQGDPTWAAALLYTLGGDARDREIAARLHRLLPPEEVVSRATKALAAGTVAGLRPLLEHCPRPWPDELSRLVLHGLVEFVKRSKARGELYHLARLAALRLPVTVTAAARELTESLRDLDGIDSVPLETLVKTLTFRHEMTEEIPMGERNEHR